MSTTQNLDNLVINKVESSAVYDNMVANNLVNENELYLVPDNDGWIDFTVTPNNDLTGTEITFSYIYCKYNPTLRLVHLTFMFGLSTDSTTSFGAGVRIKIGELNNTNILPPYPVPFSVRFSSSAIATTSKEVGMDSSGNIYFRRNTEIGVNSNLAYHTVQGMYIY